MSPRHPLAALAAAGLAAVPLVHPAFAQERDDGAERDVALTVYSAADPAGFDPQQFLAQQRMGWNPGYSWQVPGFGVVKEVRRLAMPEGRGEIRIVDVAQHIDPTTVSFADLDAPAATAVLEQSFEFDLVSPAKLIERYVDREILLRETHEESGSTVETWTKGTVLSANAGQVVLRTSDGLRFIHAQHPGIRLPSLPEGLITRPTLVWDVASESAGERRVRTTYQTGGLTWRADYNVVLAEDATSADLSAWVTLLNVSGASYGNARLKLIAGDVQRIAPSPMQGAWGPTTGGAEMDGGGGFEQKEFFEYHLYTLPRRTDVKQNATQQLALFPTATGVKTKKVLVYAGFAAPGWPRRGMNANRDLGTKSNTKVDVYVELENSEDNRMGMPLPKGKVRAYQRDAADGTLEFVGEDLIDHTPRDETVRVKLGQAFDVVGERTQTDFQMDSGRKELFETFRIEVRNHKDEPVEVIVREVLYRWSSWELVERSDDFEKIDSRTIHFPVTVPARGKRTITYKVRYTW
jgi:hypothetical protein